MIAAVDFEDWKLVELLIGNGADQAEAVPLKEDLRKTPLRDGSGRFNQAGTPARDGTS
jgi:hypothetical protein